MKVPKSLRKGQRMIVHWNDITNYGTEEPEGAELTTCETMGYYVGTKTSRGLPCLVTSSTRHPDGKYMGCDIYPLSVVARLEKI